MAYTTIAIVREESPFKDDVNIIDAYVTRAIDQADSFINGMIGSVYSLPLAEVPSVIQDMSTKISINNLLLDQNLNLEVADGVNLDAQIEDVLEMLNLIRNRELKLYDSNDEELLVNSLVKPDFFPTNASTESGETEPLFAVNKQF